MTDENGEVLDEITAILDGDEAIPERASNRLVLLAIKSERSDRRSALTAIRLLLEAIQKTSEANHQTLQGTDERPGLVKRVERLEAKVALSSWAAGIVTGGFLAALGAFFFGLLRP